MTQETSPAATGKSKSRVLDRLTLVLLGLSIFMTLCYTVIFLVPTVPFNRSAV